jgi:hypothetical protein
MWTVVLTIVFGVLNVVQFVKYLLDKKAHDVHQANLRAVRTSLQQLRAMCTEAIDTGEIINSAAARQFVRQTAYTLLTIENIIDATLPNAASGAAQQARPSWWRRLLGC